MARYTFNELLHLLEQDGASYDQGRRRMLSNAVRFWDRIVEIARTHTDPIVRAKLIGVIAGAKKIPLSQRRAALEQLLATETHEVPLRSLRYILTHSLR